MLIAAACLVAFLAVRHDPLAASGKIIPPTASTAPIVPSAANTAGHAYGIAAGSSLSSLSPEELAKRLDGIKATGAAWVRFDIDWSVVQPDNAATYQWDAYDQVVSASRQRGLNVIAIIDFTPRWARAPACPESSHCRPADPKAYAAFAKAVASRYSVQGVHTWEIWNEPNSPDFWKPAANPLAYTQMLADAYQAIHEVDSKAWVLSGGLSPQSSSDTARSPEDFLAGVYAVGGKNYFDAVADHPYTFPLSPASPAPHAWNQMASSGGSLRSIMARSGDGGKKIWMTEFGAPTGGPGPVATPTSNNLAEHPYVVDEALQAKILSDAVKLYKTYTWAGPFLYYSYQDAGTSSDTNENFFGLVRADGSHKPAYDVYRAAATP